jgi:adenylate cyclase class 2
MSVEIELKAWVDKPETVRDTVVSFAGPGVSFGKEDAYWFLPSGAGINTISKPGVRVRKETVAGTHGAVSRTTLVTFKHKELRGGIEVNDEQEFTVSDGAVFEDLLSWLGLSKGIGKKKQGTAWIYGGITLELSLVEGLGWFVELEIIADNDRPETVASARLRLLALLGKTGVGEEKIETRYYTEMLRHGGPLHPPFHSG